MTVAQWNQNRYARGRAGERAALLEDLGADVLFAQELPGHRFREWCEALGDGWWGRFSLTCRPGLPPARSFWGVAVFGRKGTVDPLETQAPQVIGDPADDSGSGLFWRRTLAVPAHTSAGPVTLVSIHVRPGASVGVQKLEFVTNVGRWLQHLDRPLVLGVDANSPGPGGKDDFWSPDPEDRERRVWGPRPAHGLTDVWRDHEIVKVGEDYTHVLKGRERVGVRFDHVWVSPDVTPTRVEHVWDEAVALGADHALVLADLELPSAASAPTHVPSA
jgi:endonuclease/exonuclease/phosphatase family metal-dependent hydrolase